LDASGLLGHITVHQDGIFGTSSIWINPILSTWLVWMCCVEISARFGRTVLVSLRRGEHFEGVLQFVVGIQYEPLLLIGGDVIAKHSGWFVTAQRVRTLSSSTLTHHGSQGSCIKARAFSRRTRRTWWTHFSSWTSFSFFALCSSRSGWTNQARGSRHTISTRSTARTHFSWLAGHTIIARWTLVSRRTCGARQTLQTNQSLVSFGSFSSSFSIFSRRPLQTRRSWLANHARRSNDTLRSTFSPLSSLSRRSHGSSLSRRTRQSGWTWRSH